MTYTTQMNAARQGIVTKEMEAVASYEGMDPQQKSHLSETFWNRELFKNKD